MEKINKQLQREESLLERDVQHASNRIEASLEASMTKALYNQNKNINKNIQNTKQTNALLFRASEYQRMQIVYLESIAYVLKFVYTALAILFLILVIYKKQLQLNIVTILILIFLPMCILPIEIIAANFVIRILSILTGNVYIPIERRNYFTSSSSSFVQ